jgi:predicted MPP superfamily phosphohydrolase
MLLSVVQHRVAPTGTWPAGLRLRIAALSDIHASEPYMSAERIRDIAARTNALEPDLIVLLGDYVAGSRIVSRYVPAGEWAPALSGLRAPLGVFAVLGNHDWWEDRTSQRTGQLPVAARALTEAGIRVLHNEAVPLRTSAETIWLAGLGDQLAFTPARLRGWRRYGGAHDLAATLAPIPEDAPMILLAHEPDIFPRVPRRVALTLSGHTHGGQVRLFGYSPIVPSARRYAWGHVREHADLVVSGGLGYSMIPVRFGVPPEITIVELGQTG